MASTPDDQIVADLRAKLAEAHAETKLTEAISRSDLKFAELIGRVDTGFVDIKGQISTVNARLDGIEKSTTGLKTTIVGTGVAVVAVVIAVMTYGQAWFGIGVSTRDVVKAAVLEMQTQTRPGAPPVP